LALLAFGMLFAHVELFDSCITVEETGTYILASDIDYSGTDSCIRIMASSVTINCDGHTLLGSYPATGILIKEGARNIAIINCNLGFFEQGITSEKDVGAIHIESTSIDSCKKGVYFHDGRDADMLGCNFTNNNIGVHLDNWVRGTTSNSYFSNRNYGAFLTSTTDYTIDSSEFTNSEYGVYTEGLCTGSTVSNSEFYVLVTPLDLYGMSSMFDGNTFYNNAGYAIQIRQAMNSFENNVFYEQPLLFATQSNAFTFMNLTLGRSGEAGAVNFRKFAAPKPFTTTRFYYFNSSNVIVQPDFVSVVSEDYSALSLEDVTVWIQDPEAGDDLAVFHENAKCTSRAQVLEEGVALAEPVPEESSPGIFSFALEYFQGSYALGERPPELPVDRYVVVLLIEAPQEAATNQLILIETKDQNAEILPGAQIYYSMDTLDPLYAGTTNSSGQLEFFISEEGAYILEARYGEVGSQRAISIVAAAEVLPEEEAESVPPADFSSEIPTEPETSFEPEPEVFTPEKEPETAAKEEFPLLLAGIGLVAFLLAAAIVWFFVSRKPPKAASHEYVKHKGTKHLKNFRKD